jgi:murein DD-endopeptidase MepM/ murein hydrolase activator NlpD
MVVDIGDGHFAVYAHLQLHSVRVKPGDRIRRDDVLGLLGNTGNTSNPHLHFHITDGPSPLASNGFPFVIVNFTDQGVVTAIDPAFEGNPPVIDPKMAGPHRDSLPLNNHIVSFE